MAVRRRLPDSGFARLTSREEQILALVAEGWSDGAIAERVMITRRSVERHVNAIFSKLGLEARDLADGHAVETLVLFGPQGERAHIRPR